MAQTKAQDEVEFLTRKEVVAKVKVTFPTIWGWMRRGKFPLSRQLGDQRVGWLKSEVEDWMLGRPPTEYKPSKRGMV